MKGLIKIIIVAFLLLTIHSKGVSGTAQDDTTTLKLDSITYDYELIHDGVKLTGCNGTFGFTVNCPEGCEAMAYLRTVRPSETFTRFYIKTTIVVSPGESKRVSINNVNWGTFLQVVALMDDYTYTLRTDTISINDYIDRVDLDALKQMSSIQSAIDDTDINIYQDSSELTIRSGENSTVIIMDLLGKLLYTTTFDGEHRIPLSSLSSEKMLLIVKSQHNSICKKFYIHPLLFLKIVNLTYATN